MKAINAIFLCWTERFDGTARVAQKAIVCTLSEGSYPIMVFVKTGRAQWWDSTFYVVPTGLPVLPRDFSFFSHRRSLFTVCCCLC